MIILVSHLYKWAVCKKKPTCFEQCVNNFWTWEFAFFFFKGMYLICHLPSRFKAPPVVVAEVGSEIPKPWKTQLVSILQLFLAIFQWNAWVDHSMKTTLINHGNYTWFYTFLEEISAVNRKKIVMYPQMISEHILKLLSTTLL